MSASALTLRGRVRAESIMDSACIITRETGKFVEDPVTLEQVPEVVKIYPPAEWLTAAGKCRLRAPNTSTLTSQLPGAVIAKDDLILSLPVDGSELVKVGDVAVLTVNPLDSTPLGEPFRIKGVHYQTHSTARRFPVEVVSNG